LIFKALQEPKQTQQDYYSDKGVENGVCQADSREEYAQSEVSCVERGSERSRADTKERLQYLATGTARTHTAQNAGYGAVTDRAAGIVNIYPRRPVLIVYLPDKLEVIYTRKYNTPLTFFR